MKFKIAQRKKNRKSKYVVAVTDVEIKLKGNKDLIEEIYSDIIKNVLNDDRMIH